MIGIVSLCSAWVAGGHFEKKNPVKYRVKNEKIIELSHQQTEKNEE